MSKRYSRVVGIGAVIVLGLAAFFAADLRFRVPGYQIQFLDDAPANASPPTAGMPQTYSDHVGGVVDLASFRGKKNVVLVFVRGVPQGSDGKFCPYCIAQTSSLMANLDEFKQRNAEVLVVFPGPAEKVKVLVAEAGKGQVTDAPFPLLLDLDLKACDALGIRGDLAKPSTYVIDKAGNVVYAYVGKYTADRPSVKAVLKQLDKLVGGTE